MSWHHLFNYQVAKAKVLPYQDKNKTEDNGVENMDAPLLYKTMKQLATQSLDCVKRMIVFFEDTRWPSLRCSTQISQGQRKNRLQWRNSIPPKLLTIEGSPCHVAPWVKWDAESWNIVHKLLDSLMLWIRIHLESNQFVRVFNFTMRFLNTLIWTSCNHPIHILCLIFLTSCCTTLTIPFMPFQASFPPTSIGLHQDYNHPISVCFPD